MSISVSLACPPSTRDLSCMSGGLTSSTVQSATTESQTMETNTCLLCACVDFLTALFFAGVVSPVKAMLLRLRDKVIR